VIILTKFNWRLKNRIWNRDKGKCQKCGKKLYEVYDSLEETLDELKKLKTIPIYKIPAVCWKCKKETDVISYNFTVGYSFKIGDVEKIDKILIKKYPFVKKIFSKTMDEETTGNVCKHCGVYQGNWYVMESLLMYEVDETLPEIFFDEIDVELTLEDLGFKGEELKPYKMKIPKIAHVHHIDGNNKNNDPSNLVLLCSSCHKKVHSENICL